MTLVESLRMEAASAQAAASAVIAAAADEIERLTKLLNMRPPYYCQNCDCERCGNTRWRKNVKETTEETR